MEATTQGSCQILQMTMHGLYAKGCAASLEGLLLSTRQICLTNTSIPSRNRRRLFSKPDRRWCRRRSRPPLDAFRWFCCRWSLSPRCACLSATNARVHEAGARFCPACLVWSATRRFVLNVVIKPNNSTALLSSPHAHWYNPHSMHTHCTYKVRNLHKMYLFWYGHRSESM